MSKDYIPLTEDEISRVRANIEELMKELGRITNYVDNNHWTKVDKQKDREEAFNFQTKIMEKRIGWLEKVLKLSNIEAFYTSQTQEDSKKVRKDSEENPMMNFFKTKDD